LTPRRTFCCCILALSIAFHIKIQNSEGVFLTVREDDEESIGRQKTHAMIGERSEKPISEQWLEIIPLSWSFDFGFYPFVGN